MKIHLQHWLFASLAIIVTNPLAWANQQVTVSNFSYKVNLGTEKQKPGLDISLKIEPSVATVNISLFTSRKPTPALVRVVESAADWRSTDTLPQARLVGYPERSPQPTAIQADIFVPYCSDCVANSNEENLTIVVAASGNTLASLFIDLQPITLALRLNEENKRLPNLNREIATLTQERDKCREEAKPVQDGPKIQLITTGPSIKTLEKSVKVSLFTPSDESFRVQAVATDLNKPNEQSSSKEYWLVPGQTATINIDDLNPGHDYKIVVKEVKAPRYRKSAENLELEKIAADERIKTKSELKDPSVNFVAGSVKTFGNNEIRGRVSVSNASSLVFMVKDSSGKAILPEPYLLSPTKDEEEFGIKVPLMLRERYKVEVKALTVLGTESDRIARKEVDVPILLPLRNETDPVEIIFGTEGIKFKVPTGDITAKISPTYDLVGSGIFQDQPPPSMKSPECLFPVKKLLALASTNNLSSGVPIKLEVSAEDGSGRKENIQLILKVAPSQLEKKSSDRIKDFVVAIGDQINATTSPREPSGKLKEVVSDVAKTSLGVLLNVFLPGLAVR